MKKPYSKPTITVGAIQLDQPIAAGCTADFEDMRSLLELGYFTAEGACASPIHGQVALGQSPCAEDRESHSGSQNQVPRYSLVGK